MENLTKFNVFRFDIYEPKDYNDELAGICGSFQGRGDCKEDHGERSNRKLRDQPFHRRGRNGKMSKW